MILFAIFMILVKFKQIVKCWKSHTFRIWTKYNSLLVIIKHVIWRFRIYSLFCDIFKFRGNVGNNKFRKLRWGVHTFWKFKCLAKQIFEEKWHQRRGAWIFRKGWPRISGGDPASTLTSHKSMHFNQSIINKEKLEISPAPFKEF